MCCVHLCQCVHLELPGCHCFKHRRKTTPYTCLRFASFSLYLNTPTRCQGSGGERRQIITVHPNLDSTFLLIMMLLLSIKTNMPRMTCSHGTACLALSEPRLQYCWFTTQNRTSLNITGKKEKSVICSAPCPSKPVLPYFLCKHKRRHSEKRVFFSLLVSVVSNIVWTPMSFSVSVLKYNFMFNRRKTVIHVFYNIRVYK